MPNKALTIALPDSGANRARVRDSLDATIATVIELDEFRSVGLTPLPGFTQLTLGPDGTYTSGDGKSVWNDGSWWVIDAGNGEDFRSTTNGHPSPVGLVYELGSDHPDYQAPGQVVDGQVVASVVLNGETAPATTSRLGLVELATDTETQTGTDYQRAVTPAGLTSRTATETRTGLVELATTAEATTGTDTARAVTPAAGRAALRDYADPIAATRDGGWDSFWFDGATTGQRVVWPLPTAAQIGESDFTLVFPIRRLAVRAGATTGLFMVSSSLSGYTEDGLTVHFFPSGVTRILRGNDMNYRRYDLSASNFLDLYLGRTGDLVLRRVAGVMSLSWVEGRTVTNIPLPTEQSGGTSPAWGSAITAPNFVLGTAFNGAHYAGELGVPQIINRAWLDADINYWAQHRRLPPQDRSGGSQTFDYAGNFASVDSFSAVTGGTVAAVGGKLQVGTVATSQWSGATRDNTAAESGQVYELVVTARVVAGTAGDWVISDLVTSSGLINLATGEAPKIAATVTDQTFTCQVLRRRGSAIYIRRAFAENSTLEVTALSIRPLGAFLQSEITRTAQALDHGPLRIRGVMTTGVRPLCDRDPVPLRGTQAATGFALGLGSADPLWFEPALVTGLRIKQSTASAQTITLRLNTSGGTVIATATTAANTDWQVVALSIPGGFEVAAGDRLHWTITNALDWDLTWSRR